MLPDVLGKSAKKTATANFRLEYASTDFDLRELYNGSALTFEGCAVDDANMTFLVEWLEESGAAPRSPLPIHVVSGQLMNEVYGLTGDNAYPDDLNIVSVMLSDMESASAIIMKRFELGGRWFDDIVDNNEMRERGASRRVAMPWHKNAPSPDSSDSEWVHIDAGDGYNEWYVWNCGQRRCIVLAHDEDVAGWAWVEYLDGYDMLTTELGTIDEHTIMDLPDVGRYEEGFSSREEAFESFSDWWIENRHTASKRVAEMYADTFEYGFMSNGEFLAGEVHIDNEEGPWTCEVYGINGDVFEGFGVSYVSAFEAAVDALEDTGLQLDDGEEQDFIEHLQFTMDEHGFKYSKRK